MDPRRLLEDNVELIDRVVRRACRRVGVSVAEVEDVASLVKLALIEDDYAILRRYEGRSSLATYLDVIVQRLLSDQHERTHGRWRASPEAERLGTRAVVIEEIVGREGRSVEEAFAIMNSTDASITRSDVVAIADQLPLRSMRPRKVELPSEDVIPLAALDCTDAATLDSELRDLSRRAGSVLRETIRVWEPADRLLVQLRFESSYTIADIARLLRVPQRPLYRRLESLLAGLRAALMTAGIDPAAAQDLLAASNRIEMDFGLTRKDGESDIFSVVTEKSRGPPDYYYEVKS